ncbi:MAG TPA: cation diffusion facilitator family transporter [Ilumatobacteraceae bacterium]|nr:cation diffusion facilitator family transporter [Ilumatobacteraceae bacterium]
MGHSHSHAAPAHGVARAGHAARLRWALVLIVGFLVVEVVVGIVSGSLTVLSDAGHMATDALGIGIALAAITAAARASTDGQRTFGLYRLEILAALANSLLLLGVATYVLVEAVLRLRDPEPVDALPVVVIGVLGLVVNVVAFLLLREGASTSLNVKGAYLEVVADLLGSVGVIIGGLLIWATGADWVDPVIGAAIGLYVVPRAISLGRTALRVLVEAAPDGMAVDDVRSALLGIDGVTDVHDLHVWTLTSEMNVLTAHVVVTDGTAPRPVLLAARGVLHDRFGLEHATLQVEEVGDDPCGDLSW